MRKLIKILVALICFCSIVAMALVIVNLRDDKLKPEVQIALGHGDELTHQALAGFKYLLAMRVAADQDPESQGEMIYQRLRASQDLALSGDEVMTPEEERALPLPVAENNICAQLAYCSQEVFEKNAESIQKSLVSAETLLRRFDRLVEYGAYGSDLKPGSIESPSLILVNLSKLKLVQLSQLIREQKEQEVFEQLTKMNRFFMQSLRYPAAASETQLKLAILQRIRNFLNEAMKESSEFTSGLAATDLAQFQISYQFDELAENAMAHELNAMKEVLGTPVKPSYFGIAERVRNNPWLERLFAKIGPLLLQENKTLNHYYSILDSQRNNECITADLPCDSQDSSPLPFFNYFENPYGKILVPVATATLVPFKQIYGALKELAEPLLLPPPPKDEKQAPDEALAPSTESK